MRLEEQMVQTEKLTSLGLLAAGVAHEVNTPLAVISNYIQMLAKQMPADDPRQKTIERIVKQTFRASEIVNNLLNFSRTGAAEFARWILTGAGGNPHAGPASLQRRACK
jgi:two-component system, NtrC family, sensor kinase